MANPAFANQQTDRMMGQGYGPDQPIDFHAEQALSQAPRPLANGPAVAAQAHQAVEILERQNRELRSAMYDLQAKLDVTRQQLHTAEAFAVQLAAKLAPKA